MEGPAVLPWVWGHMQGAGLGSEPAVHPGSGTGMLRIVVLGEVGAVLVVCKGGGGHALWKGGRGASSSASGSGSSSGSEEADEDELDVEGVARGMAGGAQLQEQGVAGGGARVLRRTASKRLPTSPSMMGFQSFDTGA